MNSEVNSNKFIDLIRKAKFYDCDCSDPNVFTSHFVSLMYRAFHESFPLKRVKVNHTHKTPAWINEDVKQLIKKKHRLLRLSNSGIIYRRSYIKYRNILSSIKKGENMYFLSVLNNIGNDTRKTWSRINKMLNKNTKKRDIKLEHRGTNVAECEISEYFNKYKYKYISSVASKLVGELPQPTQSFEVLSPRIDYTCTIDEVTTTEEVAGVLLT